MSTLGASPGLVRRYTRLTERRIALLLLALERGYSRRAAASVAGISRRSFYYWLRSPCDCQECLENAPDCTSGTVFLEPPALNVHRVEYAEAAAQVLAETVILRRVRVDPVFAWRWLERRRVENWQDPKKAARLKLLKMELRIAAIEERILREQVRLLELGITLA